MLTGAVGLITEAEQANAIVADGKADAVLIGRAFYVIHIGLCMQPWHCTLSKIGRSPINVLLLQNFCGRGKVGFA